jgi:hypothetical protein
MQGNRTHARLMNESTHTCISRICVIGKLKLKGNMAAGMKFEKVLSALPQTVSPAGEAKAESKYHLFLTFPLITLNEIQWYPFGFIGHPPLQQLQVAHLHQRPSLIN